METRKFGRTGHDSTVAIFGAFALGKLKQENADRVVQQVLDAGVNHFDIAPSYHEAELRLGPWMPQIRQQVFLGCKTMERDADGCRREMEESMQRLQVDKFDLYQLHAVREMDELDAATRKGGALEAIIEARRQGLTDYIGITGHGMNSPEVFIEALNRFDFDSVLFPINYKLYARSEYRQKAEELLRLCQERDVGTMIIKSVSKAPWGERDPQYDTWYEPFTKQQDVQIAVDFVLTQPVTGVCTAGDHRILPLMLEACENFKPMLPQEQDAWIAKGAQMEVIF
jgi:aryl-alcohol dehydrogenase-like predicted oxidoreductase